MAVKPEELLVHSDFIRVIARRLIMDQDLSADIAQETMVAALQNPPDESLPIRAWLKGVARNLTCNLIRRESRRSKREWVVATPDRVPSTSEIVELEETRQKVVEAVLSLRPIHRDVVLLRFYQDQPPKKIAEILDVSVETVDTRLQRGLKQLRKSLDKTTGGDRKKWCTALAPVAGLKLAAPAATVATAPVLAAAVLLALLTLPVYFFLTLSENTGGTHDPSLGTGGAADPSRLSAVQESDFGSWDTERLGKEEIYSEDGTEILRGRVMDMGNAPVPHAALRAVRLETLEKPLDLYHLRSYRSQSDREGYFVFEDLPPGEYVLWAVRGELAGHVKVFAAGPHTHPRGEYRDHEIVMRTSRSVRGIVRNGEGKPLVHARLAAYSPWPHTEPVSFARTDAAGRFELQHLIEGHCHILAFAEGLAPEIIRNIPSWTQDLEVTLAPGRFIQGRVTLEEMPRTGVEVGVTLSKIEQQVRIYLQSQTDESGYYRLGPLPRDPDYYLSPLNVRAQGYVVLDGPDLTTQGSVDGQDLVTNADVTLVPGGSASGRITDRKKGAPLSDVWVTAFSVGGSAFHDKIQPIHVKTGEDGAFLFPSLVPGDFFFWTHAHGSFAPETSGEEKTTILAGDYKSGIHIQADRGASVRVSVMGDEDAPMENAWVRLKNKNPSDSFQMQYDELGLLPKAKDLGNGQYLFDGVGPGIYEIIASQRGWQRASTTINIRPILKSQEVRLDMTHCYPFTCEVEDGSGKPVAGASLEITKGWNLFTDEEGCFRIDDMVPHEGRIIVNAPGFMEFKKSVHFKEDMKEILLSLKKEGPYILAGVIQDNSGKPVMGATFSVEQLCGKDDYFHHHLHRNVRAVKTDQDGRFLVTGLIDQPVTPGIEWSEGYEAQKYEAIPVNRSDLKIIMNRYPRISGTVSDLEGKPVPLFKISVLQEEKSISSQTYRNGRYEIKTKTGEVVVQASGEELAWSRTVPIILEPGDLLDKVDFRLGPGATLSGVVRDETTREPVANATLYAHESRGNRGVRSGKPKVQTGKDGFFEFTGLQEGHGYLVEVEHPDYALLLQPGIEVKSGWAGNVQDLHLSKGCALEGRVYRDGQGVAGATVFMSHLAASAANTVSGTEGYYRIDHLPSGMGFLNAKLDDAGRGSAEIRHFIDMSSGSKTCDFHFGSGSISGTVRAFGEPESGVYILATRVTDRDGKPDQRSRYYFNTSSYGDGSFRITNLPPGFYSLSGSWSRREGSLSACKELSVMNEEVAVELDIGSDSAGEIHGVVREDGLGMADMEVRLEGDDPRFYLKAKTDGSGLFRFTNVPAGEMRISVGGAAAGLGLMQHLSLDTGEILQHDLSWTRGTGVIHGKVSCQGMPFDAPLEITRYDDQAPAPEGIFTTCKAEGGGFRLSGLPAGLYRVTSEQPWEIHKMVEVKEGTEAMVEFRYIQGEARIQGTVEERTDQDETSYVMVFLFHENACELELNQPFTPSVAYEGMVRVKTVSPSLGNLFDFKDLTSGTYDLAAIQVKQGMVCEMCVEKITLDGSKPEVVRLLLSR